MLDILIPYKLFDSFRRISFVKGYGIKRQYILFISFMLIGHINSFDSVVEKLDNLHAYSKTR